ncbi:MAG: circadian clock protein KaiA [Cyanobacteria bacterium J06648_10]
MPAQFLVGVFVPAESLADPLRQLLAQKDFIVSWSQSAVDFTDWVISNRHRIDCLIVQASSEAVQALIDLKSRDILLPALMVHFSDVLEENGVQESSSYHAAVASFGISSANGLDDAVRRAVDLYLKLPTDGETAVSEGRSLPKGAIASASDDVDKRLFLLSLQQQRLSEKLQERLGYLGVYYKRNQQNFSRHMSPEDRQEFLDKLRLDYQNIILNYFANDDAINQKIDDFVNVAFFADISVPKIVEIHMELIDDFSKQLQLEGRNDGILADYRLTLIDVIAHLCEMYRRSIPRTL